MARRTVVLLAAVLIAAVGVALIFVYVNRADERAKDGQAEQPILVAAGIIKAGTTLKKAADDGLFRPDTIKAELRPAAALTLADVQDAANGPLVAQADILQGETVRLDRFGSTAPTVQNPSEITESALALSLGDPNRIASYLKPGIFVRIFATDKTTRKTELAEAKVKVLKVGSKGVSGTAPDAELPQDLATALVTFEVTERQTIDLLDYQAKADLWMTALGSKVAGS